MIRFGSKDNFAEQQRPSETVLAVPAKAGPPKGNKDAKEKG